MFFFFFFFFKLLLACGIGTFLFYFLNVHLGAYSSKFKFNFFLMNDQIRYQTDSTAAHGLERDFLYTDKSYKYK